MTKEGSTNANRVRKTTRQIQKGATKGGRKLQATASVSQRTKAVRKPASSKSDSSTRKPGARVKRGAAKAVPARAEAKRTEQPVVEKVIYRTEKVVDPTSIVLTLGLGLLAGVSVALAIW